MNLSRNLKYFLVCLFMRVRIDQPSQVYYSSDLEIAFLNNNPLYMRCYVCKLVIEIDFHSK